MQSQTPGSSMATKLTPPSSTTKSAQRVPVIHVLDGVLLGSQYLWGKEQVVSNLMHAQERSSKFAPELAVFSSCLLSERIEADGFPVAILCAGESGSPWQGLRALMRRLHAAPTAILHTHGFKANVVGRMARWFGAPMTGIVSTSHGFDDTAARLRFYNALDRMTSPASDVVTMPDEAMLARFPRAANAKFVPNAIPDQPLPTLEDRARARQRFGWVEPDFVAGAMGRLSEAKGIPEFIGAALSTRAPLRWAVAGVGPLQDELDRCDQSRIQALGYVSPSDDYITAIDVYVQSSRGEGLSLSLLQAMRAAKPIVATRVNATELAVRDGIDGILVEPRSASAMADGVERMRTDPVLARRLGASARARFLEKFLVERQAEAYEELYSRVCESRGRTETGTT
jgi:glycosyltransferase involved in cell wall biosynthesis